MTPRETRLIVTVVLVVVGFVVIVATALHTTKTLNDQPDPYAPACITVTGEQC
jgi:hypothetical protein